jgi:putative endonuclease
MTKTELGRWGEMIASQALESHGYQVVEKNWRCKTGELDLVTRDGECWVFVEVKVRSSDTFGTPEEAVTPTKQERLLTTGMMYLAEHGLEEVGWRIDVVAIKLADSGKVDSLTIYQDAVRIDG